MTQKTDHLKMGDLVLIQAGWSHKNYLCVFVKSTKVSIHYYDIGYTNLQHIRTRNSKYQRIYKISVDNLTDEERKAYNDTWNICIKPILFPKTVKKVKKVKQVAPTKFTQLVNETFINHLID